MLLKNVGQLDSLTRVYEDPPTYIVSPLFDIAHMTAFADDKQIMECNVDLEAFIWQLA